MAQETVYIRHTFTPEERIKLGEEMAQAAATMKAKQDDLKAMQSSYKASIDLQAATVNLHATKIQNGYETRNVLCNVSYDHEKKEVNYIEETTGEVVQTRPMTKDEQLKLAEQVKELTK